MKVKSIAECSPWSILQYFWPAFSGNWSCKPIFGVFESGRFTQVLLYWVNRKIWIHIIYNIGYQCISVEKQAESLQLLISVSNCLQFKFHYQVFHSKDSFKNSKQWTAWSFCKETTDLNYRLFN